MNAIDSQNLTDSAWQNWSGNLKHLPPKNGQSYYLFPKDEADLRNAISKAREIGVCLRVSGQRHSQPPLVAKDNRDDWSEKPSTILVDMSCYIDIKGQSDTDGIMMGPGPNQITVNPGLREDLVDAFLTNHNLMFKTVTAGGFFSLGGMTAVDVHGATVDAPIFSETASGFRIMQSDGTFLDIDENSPMVDGWSPLQFARVSLGGLGIVTRITIDVQPRPFANSLQGGHDRHFWKDQKSFAKDMSDLLIGQNKHDRVEVFFTPYAAAWSVKNFVVLHWNEIAKPIPEIPNHAALPKTACELAQQDDFGAPMIGGIGDVAIPVIRDAQTFQDAYLPPITPIATAAGLDEIEAQVDAANKIHSDLWLTKASDVMFMSYFIELPDLSPSSMETVWKALDCVATRTIKHGQFHLAAPMEFRFMRGGNSALAGTYSENPDAHFVNLDLIGFVEPIPSNEYPPKLLQFFADVERDWVEMGGFPHNGKMYGFYDPEAPSGSFTNAFNPKFLAHLGKRRGARLQAYKSFRDQMDPEGLFLNPYLSDILA